MNDLHRQWYDWTLKNGPKPEFLKKRVAYYVVGPGAETWKYADDLYAIATAHRKLQLTSLAGTANDVFHSGQIADQPPSFGGGQVCVRSERLTRSITDERYPLNLFGSGVVYHSAPFPEATELSGHMQFIMWMAMEVSDTDFAVTLYEILNDGTNVQLSKDALRARYRESLRQAKLVTPGQITRYDFDGLTWFWRRVSNGSRLRLVLNCLNSINFERNDS